MPVEIQYDDVSFGQLYKYANGKDEYIERGKAFKITKIAEDIDTDEVFYDVECQKLGKNKVFTIPKSDAIDINNVKKYHKYGLDVNDANRAIVTELFQIMEDDYVEEGLPIFRVHSEAGVKIHQDENGDSLMVYVGAECPVSHSKYIGKFDLQPKGSRDAWFALVKNLVKESVQGSFVICVAFGAILMGVLKENVVDLDNLIVHLRGDSSSGKTTMLNLAISVFGNPDEHCRNGLISTWNATQNALLRRLMSHGNGKGGNLYGLDEFSMLQVKDCTNLIYAITSGIERDRLTANIQTQDRLTGTYILMSTGESSLLGRTNGNIGLAMRVLEMDDQMWTKDSETSEKIKNIVKQNYGFAAEEFGLKLGKYIQVNKLAHLVDRFNYWRGYYCDRCDTKERRERMSSRYGLILLAAQFSNEFFNFEIDSEALCQFMVDNENSNVDQREGYAGCYDKIVAYIVSNMPKFQRISSCKKKNVLHSEGDIVSEDLPRDKWGYIVSVDQKIKVDGMYVQEVAYIFRPVFERMVKRLGYEDEKAIRKYLKKKGYTECMNDRGYVRKTFDRGITLDYVGVYLTGDNAEIVRMKICKKATHIFRSFPEKFKSKDLKAIQKDINMLFAIKEDLEDEQKKKLLRYMQKFNELEKELQNSNEEKYSENVKSLLCNDVDD